MLKKLFQEWRIFLPLVVMVVGLAVPVWLSRQEQGGKQLSVYLLSQTSLQPPTDESMPELHLTLDNVSVEDPVFSLLQVANDGSKPISTKDFESPLEITTVPTLSFDCLMLC